MVGFTSTPVVNDIGQNDVRGYTLGSDRSNNITLNILLVVNTSLSGQPLCENPLLDVTCELTTIPKVNSTRLEAHIISNAEPRIGVFTAYAEKGNRSGTATIIVHHAKTPVIPIVRTKTVSVCDSNVTLSVNQSSGNIESLRWAKNGDYNEEWDGLTEIFFKNITLNDSGIYECYINGSRNEGKYAFMQMIVRECPHNKWSPPNCIMECDVCYNGGVCDTYIGTCICPSGFIGNRCEIPAGGNLFGRDGKVTCSSSTIDNGCRGNLICPPMPQGCACHAGWKGLDCNTECEAGKYGADCRQICHCDADQCDHSSGCNENATCHTGYNGTRCLDSTAIIKIICEDRTDNLTCDSMYTIRVLTAVYGRMHPGVVYCNHQYSTNCTMDVFQDISGMCDGKNRCTITASNSNYDDPCEGTHKYLNIKYECMILSEDSPTSFRGHTTHGRVHSINHTACSVTTTDGNVLSTKLTWIYNSYYSSMIVCLGMEEYV
ncbi:tyrosine-protein kinase receptor Tie-1-like isoform X3 [Anneissia japonica]|nr:tyrosine-protein kinase receptor Tie-1-like isoform X3 [Anneissia japonica]XP_033110170.1 tyrosine-protein kinase receptor Tie-1-like isoform X3 [Anneissia japonica]